MRGEGRIASLESWSSADRSFRTTRWSWRRVARRPCLCAGSRGVPFWTSRDATSGREVPASLAVLGGGVVGCELAQLYRRLGTEVDLVQIGPPPRENEEAGALLGRRCTEEGCASTCTEAEASSAPARRTAPSAWPDGGDIRDDGSWSRPGGGLGWRISARGAGGPAESRAASWTSGCERRTASGPSVTSPDRTLHHVGSTRDGSPRGTWPGGEVRADYRAVPAVTFTDPAGSVRRWTDGRGNGAVEVGTASRHSTYARPKRKLFVKLFADPERRVLVGAAIVGPEAGEWLGQLILAVRAEIPVDVLGTPSSRTRPSAKPSTSRPATCLCNSQPTASSTTERVPVPGTGPCPQRTGGACARGSAALASRHGGGIELVGGLAGVPLFADLARPQLEEIAPATRNRRRACASSAEALEARTSRDPRGRRPP